MRRGARARARGGEWEGKSRARVDAAAVRMTVRVGEGEGEGGDMSERSCSTNNDQYYSPAAQRVEVLDTRPAPPQLTRRIS